MRESVDRLEREARRGLKWFWRAFKRYCILLATMFIIETVIGFILPHSFEELRIWDQRVATSVNQWDAWHLSRLFFDDLFHDGIFRIFCYRDTEGLHISWLNPRDRERESLARSQAQTQRSLEAIRTLANQSSHADLQSFAPASAPPPAQSLVHEHHSEFVLPFGSTTEQEGYYHVPDGLIFYIINVPFAYFMCISQLVRESIMNAILGGIMALIGLGYVFGDDKAGDWQLLLIFPIVFSVFMFVLAKIMFAAFFLFGRLVALVQTATGVSLIHSILDLIGREREHSASEHVAKVVEKHLG